MTSVGQSVNNDLMGLVSPLSARQLDISRFDLDVPAGGYAWWYVDALSDDGKYGFTVIAFIGSVFSPYYAWSGRARPHNHCAINVALYGPDRTRWAMTERGARDLETGPDWFRVGPSEIHRRPDSLEIQICERGAPFPRKVEGTIRLTLDTPHQTIFDIAGNGRHDWQPIAPSARVEVAFTAPELSWSGQAYFDHNRGRAPLEDDFSYWDWARGDLSSGETVIFYNTDLRDGRSLRLSRVFKKDGTSTPIPHPPKHILKPSPIFRIKRRTAADTAYVRKGAIQTLEDTPFYARSVIDSWAMGEPVRMMHESYVGGRFRSPITKLMLPFRMPRIAGSGKPTSSRP
ncbi:MAG: carotenoid 1,2-hydratase [Henriciella sp.]